MRGTTLRQVLESLLLALAAAVAALGAVGVLSSGRALAIGAVLAAPGLALHLRGRGELARRRRDADLLLGAIPGRRVPDGLTWRAAELTAKRNRRLLARALRGVLRDLDLPPRLAQIPINRRAVRRERAAVAAIAARLASLERPVSARAVVLLQRLLTEPAMSPLYTADAERELGSVLAEVRAEIDR